MIAAFPKQSFSSIFLHELVDRQSAVEEVILFHRDNPDICEAATILQCPLGELPRGLGGGTGTYPQPEASSGGFVGRFAQPLQLRKLKSTRIGCWANRPGITPGSYWNPAGLSGQPCVADGQAAQFVWTSRPCCASTGSSTRQGKPLRRGSCLAATRPGSQPGWANLQVAILACGRARLQGYATLEGTPSPSWWDASLGSRKLGDGLSGLPSRAAHPVGARVPPGRVPRQGSRAPRWCRC